ncbi:MAG: DUF2905 domain-containing protein [Candidatus Omnitrophica bacterium]|nr:DUF2905 domain-containing protein [Candidatus Omnitrophota bacterium]
MNPGKTLVLIGLLAVVVGLVLMGLGKLPGFGKIPGDIVVQRNNFTFYFPLKTCILISLVISLVLWLFGRR